MVEDAHVRLPQVPPAWIALLIAAVSSVTPSPIYSNFVRNKFYNAGKTRIFTFGAKIPNVSSDNITSRIIVVGGYSPLWHIREPETRTIRWAGSNIGLDINSQSSRSVEIFVDMSMASWSANRGRQDQRNNTQNCKEACSLEAKKTKFSFPITIEYVLHHFEYTYKRSERTNRILPVTGTGANRLRHV